MKRLFIVCLVFAVAMTFGFTSAFAGPSAKATAQCGDISYVPADDAWHTIFSQDIKKPTGKDVFVDVSLECGLVTNTKVMSKALIKDLSRAIAQVKVRVLVDPIYDGNETIDWYYEALPGAITFAEREQTLIAEFAGSLAIPDGYEWSDCLETDPYYWHNNN